MKTNMNMKPCIAVAALCVSTVGMPDALSDAIGMKALPPEGSEPWMKMETAKFLPCIDKYGQFRWRDWPGKTKSDDDLRRVADDEAKDLAAHPGPTDWDQYGGWTAGPKLAATGRFRTEKLNGKWWLVDPDGRLYWSFGPVRVTPEQKALVSNYATLTTAETKYFEAEMLTLGFVIDSPRPSLVG